MGRPRPRSVADASAGFEPSITDSRGDARKAIDAATTEEEWQSVVTDLLDARGWYWHHTFDSRHSKEGFPDIVAVRRGRVVFAELKKEKGVATPKQLATLATLRHHGQEVYIWRPRHIRAVEEALR